MKLMHNGWYVPEDDLKITHVLSEDRDKSNPSYEGKYRNQILQQIPNRRTFVDVGANVGIWSFHLAGKFKHTISYEPSRQVLDCLKANIKSLTEIREKAIANFIGEAEFHQAGKNCGDGKLCREGIKSSYSVPVVTLDSEKLVDVDLIKIDVQGWEYEVLDGAHNLITRDQPWIIFEVNEDINKCCKLMESHNYEVVMLKSKRLFLWAPKKGRNTPTDKSIFGRYLGPGPYGDSLS